MIIFFLSRNQTNSVADNSDLQFNQNSIFKIRREKNIFLKSTTFFGTAAVPFLSNGILLIQCNLPGFYTQGRHRKHNHTIFTYNFRILPFPAMISSLVFN